MEAAAYPHRTLLRRQPANHWAQNYRPSLLATVLSYFVIFYLYSALALVVMLLYPAIKVAYFLYFLLAAAVLLLAINRSAIRVLYDHWPFVLLMVVYFAYITVQYVLNGMADNSAVRDGYFAKGQFFSTILFSLIVFGLSANFRHLLISLYCVVVISCVVNTIEFFDPSVLPMQFSGVPGRAAGFFENPNASAMFIASTIPLLCGTMRSKNRLLCYGITGIGTFVTFSRGGWALWLAAIIITEIGLTDWRNVRLDARSIGATAAWILGAIALVIALGPALSFLISELAPNLDANTTIRLEVLANDTTVYRLEDVRHGLMVFTDAPIFGNGVSYTFQWVYGESVHNMFVLMLAEQGILGFIWLMAVLAVWWRYPRPYGWWLVVLFCVTGVTTHNYFDGAGPAILIALYLAASHKLGGYNSPDAESRIRYAQSR